MIENQNGSIISTIITASANFSVQYNFQCIAACLLIMSTSQCTLDDINQCMQGKQATWVHGASSAVIFAGCIFGQLFMGSLGDLIGRSRALYFTLLIASISSISSAVFPTGDAASIYKTIIACRFFLGIGLGGVFPLSAVKSSENMKLKNENDQHINAIKAGMTFFWQMPGMMGPWLMTYLIFTLIPDVSVSFAWRFVLGFGSIPSILSLVCIVIERNMNSKENQLLQQVETNRINDSNEYNTYSNETIDFQNNSSDIILVQEKWKEPISYMIGSGGTWLLFDIIAFGVSLSGASIIHEISPYTTNISSPSNIASVSQKQLLASFMNVPATIIALCMLPKLGLKYLQVISFLFIALCLVILGSLIDLNIREHTNSTLLLVLYCLLNFAMHSGCNVTVFALPSALYNKDVRSTYAGIASALGKFGAVIGSYTFDDIAKEYSYKVVMGICCGICILGSIISQKCLDNDRINATVIYDYTLPSFLNIFSTSQFQNYQTDSSDATRTTSNQYQHYQISTNDSIHDSSIDVNIKRHIVDSNDDEDQELASKSVAMSVIRKI